MAETDKTASEKLADSVALRLLGRLSMVIATSVILPAALLLGSRGLDTIDGISKKLDAMKEASIEQAGEIKALRVQSTTQQQILADHEARVRVLENVNRTTTRQ